MSQSFSRLKRLALFFALIVFSLVLAACSEDADDTDGDNGAITRGPETPIVIRAGEPIVIGVSAALSGDDAELGISARDAAVVGVERWKAANGEQIGGHDIEIHAEDDGCSDVGITVVAAGHLLRGEGGHRQLPGLVGVIGPMCSAGALAVMQEYASAGIVMISGSATRTDLTLTQPEPKFFFRTTYTNAGEGALQARYIFARLSDVMTAYVIDDSEAYGQDLADAAQAELEDSGRTVTRESIERGTVDFSALADRIAAENPDIVIFEGFNPEAALFYRQLRDAGYSGPFMSDDGAASVSQFIEPVGDQAEGVLFAGCLKELPEDFLADYTDIIGGEAPTVPFVAQYADAATILLDAVAEVAVEQEDGSLEIDPLELRDAVSAPKLLAGISGAIAFDQNGDRVGQGSALVMCAVEGGKLINIRF